MVVEIKSKKYTPKEYLELETAAENKHEYREGEIIAMTGGSANHNDIAGNFYAHLKFALRQKAYKVFIGDVRLWISTSQLFTYPDVMLIAREPVFYAERTDTVTNPQLIVEVLSKSTRNYDQGDKFDAYRTIPEFREYLLVDQYRIYVKHFIKTEEGYWLLKEYRELQQIVNLESVDFKIRLNEIYEGVNLQNP
ncbi:Uma2 family endonuclease [Baaleninema simplex]|uniref:Uma2 family endonuclease n=1 Tax=Baaleninema simplex TaxID=2862350 RepID=UPI000344CD49|nr:Uma2 family endonuclease [Baaleninema simplex]